MREASVHTHTHTHTHTQSQYSALAGTLGASSHPLSGAVRVFPPSPHLHFGSGRERVAEGSLWRHCPSTSCRSVLEQHSSRGHEAAADHSVHREGRLQRPSVMCSLKSLEDNCFTCSFKVCLCVFAFKDNYS